MFSFLNGPLGWIISLCYKLVDNYAIALLLFALVMQIILLPFGIKQQKNSVKQAKMRPKEMAIRNKYKGRNDRETQQKMQNEILEMYKQENYSTMAGCLPLLIQLPILFALFAVVTQPLTYICGFDKADIYSFTTEYIDYEIYDDVYNAAAADLGVDIANGEKFEDKYNALGDKEKIDFKEKAVIYGIWDADRASVIGKDGFEFESVDFVKMSEEAKVTVKAEIEEINAKYRVWNSDNFKLVGQDEFTSYNEINLIHDIKKIIDNGETPFVYTEDGEVKTVTAETLPNFNLVGNFMDLSETPTFDNFGTSVSWLLLIPLFTAVFTYGSQFITKKFTYQSTIQENQDAGCSMKIMQYAMPLLSVFISFQMAAAVGLYWIFRNILGTVQTITLAKAIPLPKFTEEDYKAAERELKGKSPKSNGEKKSSNSNKVRSLHRIDEEDDDVPSAPVKKSGTRFDRDDDGDEKPVIDENVPKLKDESDRRANRENNEKSE